jgi:O-antigen ligase
MSRGLLFWLLVLLAIIFGPWPFWGENKIRPFAFYGFIFILVALLGWKVFGPALHG